MKSTTFIYTLSDKSGNIRYIGKSNTPRKRLYSHIIECKTDRISHKINWIKSLLNKNEVPIIDILDEVLIEDWEFWERYWIEQFLQWGFNLTNIATGGINGNDYKRTESTKQKMRVSKLGTTLSTEHKKNISDSVKLKAKENPFYNRGKGNSKSIIDKELLYQKYIIENLSLNKCASFFGFSKKKIFVNITEYGFKKEKSEWIEQVISNPMKTISQYDKSGILIKEWIGLKSIQNELNINSGNVSSCCRGIAKSAGGFIWKYKNVSDI